MCVLLGERAASTAAYLGIRLSRQRSYYSRPVEPFWSGRPLISGAVRSHAASLKISRSITPKTASPKAASNMICS